MNESVNIGLFVILAGLAVGGLIFLSIWLEHKKREAFRTIASQLGLSYDHEKNHSLAERLGFLNRLDTGSNRYASHVLSGKFEDREVLVFDYHYETYSSNSKGGRQTHHHNYSVFTIRLPRVFPELTIRPEGVLSKIAQALGYDDIDFESAEFSRHFCVRSTDRKFAYAVCHPGVMEFLLQNMDMDIEMESSVLASIQTQPLNPEHVAPELRRLIGFHQLLPDYLLKADS